MGKGSNTTTSTTSPSGQAMNAYSDVLNQAQGVAATPYQPYTGQLVAPFNAQQNLGVAGINQYANAAQPAIGQAEGLVQNASQPLTQAQIQQYMSPYTQDVVNATQAQFNNQNAIQQQGVTGNAIAQGALGGNRSAIAAAETANQQQLAQAPVIAGLENQGYQTGLQTAQQQFQTNPMTAGMNLGNLGISGQTAGLSGAAAQFGAGTAQQQTQQAQDTAAYQQYLQQQAYPFQTTQWLAGLDTGVGSQMGGTSSTTAPPPNPWSTILGGAAAGAGTLGATGAFGSAGWLAPAVAGLARGGLVQLDEVLKRASGGVANYVPGYASGGSPAPAGMPWAGAPTYVPNYPIAHGPGAPHAPAPYNVPANPLANQANSVGSLAKNITDGLHGVSGPAYGGGSAAGGDAYGGSAASPLPGLVGGSGPNSDYGPMARGGVASFADGGSPDDDPVSDDDRAKGLNLLKQDMDPTVQNTDDNRAIGYDMLRRGLGTRAPDSIPGGEPLKPKDQDKPTWDDGNGPVRLDPDADERWRKNRPIAPANGPQPPPDRNDLQLSPTEVAAGNNGVNFPSEITTGRSKGIAPADTTALAYGEGAPTRGLAPPERVAEQAAEHPGGFDWGSGNKLWPALMSAGFGMMASRSPFLGNAIGEGGQAGMNQFGALTKADQEAKEHAEKLELEREQLEKPYSEMTVAQKNAAINQPVIIDANGKPHVNDAYVAATQATQRDLAPKVTSDVNPLTGEVTHSVYDPNTKKFTMYDSQGRPISAPSDKPPIPPPVPTGSNPTQDIDPVKTVEQSGTTGLNKAQTAAPYNYSMHAPIIEKGMDVPEPDLSYIPRQSAATLKADAAKYLQTGQLPPAPASRNSPLAVMATNYRAAVQNYGNAIAQSRGINPDHLAAMWRTAPDLPKFIIGTPGQATVSLGVAVSHLDTLKQYIDAARFPDTPLFKQIQAKISREFGASAATNVDAAASVVGPEIVKAIGIAGAGTSEERDKASKMFMGGAKQATDAIGVVQHLMAGQLDGKQRQAEAVGMPDEMFRGLIGNRAYDLLKDIDKKEGATIQTPADQQAIKWANEHPNDPRAAKIKKLHGVQ